MKKVIKPSKQPTKKQSQRRQRSVRNTNTAKLKKAIGKIAAQLVKDHPKLVKGGGSSGITDLIFSKNLMKGGEINDTLRGEIEKFLKVSAPKVNDLKKELLIQIIEYFIDNEKSVLDDKEQILNLYKEFNKGVYEYEYEDNYKEPFKDKEDIYEDFIILDIVKKFFILSRIKDDIPEKISDVKFVKFSEEFIAALNSYDHSNTDENKAEVKTKIKGLLDKYIKGEGEVVVVAKEAGEKNIGFELNIRIDAAIQAAIAANNELENIKIALDKKTAADTDASAAEAVTEAAKAALTKVTAAAEAVTAAALKKATEAVEKADTKAAVEEAGKDAVIAAIAALSAIYADNNDGIEEVEKVEEKKEKVEDALVVINSSKNKVTNLLAVNEILNIMKNKPSDDKNQRALDVLLNQSIEGEDIKKKIARVAATVAADSVKDAR